MGASSGARRRAWLASWLLLLFVVLPGCGLTLTVTGVVIYLVTDDDDDKNGGPIGIATTPTGLVNDVVTIPITLIDGEGDAVSLDVRWSTDGGATWSATPATGASGKAQHSGVSRLGTSAGGVAHTFLWNSFVDLAQVAPVADNYARVKVQFTVSQADGQGSVFETGEFAVWNRYTASVAGAEGAQFLDGVVGPAGLARRPNGNLIVADLFGQKVVEIDAISGTMTILAGTGIAGFNGDNIPATTAQLDFPSDVAVDSQGNIFIADTGNASIRMVDATTGFITRVAGGNGWGFFGDGGPAVNCVLAGPEAVNVDPNDNLWIADTANNAVRFVNRGTTTVTFNYWSGSINAVTVSPGAIETLAGGPSAVATGEGVDPSTAQLNAPREALPLFWPGSTVVFGFAISDSGNGRVRVVSLNGVPGTTLTPFYGTNVLAGTIQTVAGGGNASSGGIGDNGNAVNAVLNIPTRLSVFGNFLLYIADSGHGRVRAVVPTGPFGTIITLVGNGGFGFGGDGGPPQLATLASPYGVLTDLNFNIYIGDTFNGRVRMVNAQLWNAIHAISGSTIVAAGSTGTVLTGGGLTQFTSQSIGAVDNMLGISASGANDVVTVGDQGRIARWNGTAWTLETSGTTNILYAAHALSATDQYAVGLNGTILNYNGSTWSQQAAGLTSNILRGVYGGTAANVFAVGGQSTVLRYSGSPVPAWAAAPGVPAVPAGTQFRAVHGTASGADVYVVGETQGSPNGPVILHWNSSPAPNGTWTNLTGTLTTDATNAAVTAEPLYGVFVTAAGRCVAVGNSGFITVYNSSGSPNFTFPATGATEDLNAVHGTGPNNVYVIGSGDTLMRWNGTNWLQLLPDSRAFFAGVAIEAGDIQSITQPPSQTVLAVQAPTGVAVDTNGDVYFSNSEGHQVFKLDITTRALTEVAGTGAPGFAGDGGAAGAGGALIGQNLHAVWGASASDVWAAGEEGVVLRYNGTAWSVYRAADSTAPDVNGIHGVSATDAWAVGDGGAIWRWNGTGWSPQASPVTDDLRDVFALSATNVYAAGTDGTIIHFNGTGWTRLAGGILGAQGVGPIVDFHGVWGDPTSGDVWAVGDGSGVNGQGPLWRRPGGTGPWVLVAVPTGGSAPGPVVGLRSVHGFSSSDVYFTGETGVIYHWNGSATTHETSAGYPRPTLNAVFGRVGGANPNADLFAAGDFGDFLGGLGSDNWCSGCGVNDTIISTTTWTGGIAFPSGPAFLVGHNGTVFTQTTAGGAWTLQVGHGQLDTPRGLCLYSPAAGGGPILLVADSDNHRIRGINLGTTAVTLFPNGSTPITIAPGSIETVAGQQNPPPAGPPSAPYGDGGHALLAFLLVPYDVQVDNATGDIYIGDTGYDTVRRINGNDGVINTFAGTPGTNGYTGDGGVATSATLDTPTGITFNRIDASNVEVFIADTLNHVIRHVPATGAGNAPTPGNITTVAGTGNAGFNTDGLAPTATDLALPVKAVRGGPSNNTLYIVDSQNHRIRAMPLSGAAPTVRTVAGDGFPEYGGDPKPATFSSFNAPFYAVWNAASGTLYVGDTDNDRVRRFRP